MHALPAVNYLGHVLIDCNAGNHVALAQALNKEPTDNEINSLMN